MRRKGLLLSFLLVFLLIISCAQIDAARYMVRANNGHRLLSEFSLKQNSFESIGDDVFVVEGIDESALRSDAGIAYFEEDHVVKALDGQTPWNFQVLGVNFSYIGEGFGEGVRVAVLDTGADFSLLDVESGHDFVNEDPDASDDSWHGTAVTQILRAPGSNLPLVGAEVYAVKVLDEQGEGYDSDIIQAINWAIDNDIDIVSMSFGGEDDSFFLHEAIDLAYENGILLIAAAGNDGQRQVLYPAAYGSVIAVGSVNEALQRSSFSNYGPELELVAPGEDILVTDGLDYYYVGGTSFSAPHVTAVAAGVFSDSGLDASGVRSILQSRAFDRGASGWDEHYGFGVVRYYPQCFGGACCDSQGYFRPGGTQPTGYADNTMCVAGDVMTRDYYCNGESVDAFYQDILVQNCGISDCGAWQADYCYGGDVYRSRACYDRGCSGLACFSVPQAEDELVEECVFGCADGTCNIGSSEALCSVYSPSDELVLGDRRVVFNISAFEEMSSIEYIDYSDSRPRWARLCSRCGEYGFERERTKSFNDGGHEIAIKCVPYSGEVEVYELSFFSDSKAPKISRTEPRRNSFTNGSDFSVRYTEENVVSVELNFGSSEVLGDCPDGKNQECFFDVDLSGYDGQEVAYSFVIEDVAGHTDESRSVVVKIDITPPVLNNPGSFWEQDGRRVYFNLNVDEDNLDGINYIDLSESRPREKRLCSRLRNGVCEVRKSFRSGGHDLIITILDEAGNSYQTQIGFEV
ncbi:MAG: S8 family peptidase [archaeon]